MPRFAALIVALGIAAVPIQAFAHPRHAKTPKISHHQARDQQKAMKKAVKTQQKDLKKTRQRGHQ
jgi:hypothetical protein